MQEEIIQENLEEEIDKLNKVLEKLTTSKPVKIENDSVKSFRTYCNQFEAAAPATEPNYFYAERQ